MRSQTKLFQKIANLAVLVVLVLSNLGASAPRSFGPARAAVNTNTPSDMGATLKKST